MKSIANFLVNALVVTVFITWPWILGSIIDWVVFLRVESPLNWEQPARVIALILSGLMTMLVLFAFIDINTEDNPYDY